MKTYLPVGTAKNKEEKVLTKGDIIKLDNGETAVFMEMKNTRYLAKMKGKIYSVPVYRERSGTTPTIVEITGQKDLSVLTDTTRKIDLKTRDLFAIEGKKETFVFIELNAKRQVIARNIANGRRIRIGEGFEFVKIDLEKILDEI